ncbi:hypothetical protein EPH95_07315 [Salicibibacter halophilus]|uniref:Nuclear transport factor 2 family protein n=1 Tax=Salicibibacter halophilus TaxID=2502791 RepID=A0A514LGN4_9BACI|nr:nuclear transport factor 2 family protein [Salicibibacter halophilus]QDI91013.1 hypothetical protein EPH95_07315 [Salicibibacter halophilus]
MKVVWHGVLLLTGLLLSVSCFHESDVSHSNDVDDDSGDQHAEDTDVDHEESASADSSSEEMLQSFIFHYFEAVNSGDEEEIELMSQLRSDENDIQNILEQFDNFQIESINIKTMEQEQASPLQHFYEHDIEEAEAASVLLEGHFQGEEGDRYGNGDVVIRNDLLVNEQGENSEVIDSFIHTPVSPEQSATAQGGLLFTPEAFVAEYYNRLENENYEQLFELFSEEYRQDELQMTADQYVELLAEGEAQFQDVHVTMGELYEEEIQEVVPDLLAYTTDNDDYIVRAQYRPGSDERLFTEDVLVSEIGGEWRISMIHRYE